jgi:branched-subunit amino acid aminotransferase/4-amino-4-deoxychorismate lyase
MNNFRLIETMRVSETGEVYLVDRHLARLSRSASYFSFTCDPERVRDAVLRFAELAQKPARLRLTLSSDGIPLVETGPLPVGYVERLKLSSVKVNPKDVFLYHKTTNRGIYEQARRECAAGSDAILVNERGEITETPIMNIAVFRNGRWVTPQVECGLLPGVMREELLERREVVEGVIPASELQVGETVRCFNALRGIFDVSLDIERDSPPRDEGNLRH